MSHELNELFCGAGIMLSIHGCDSLVHVVEDVFECGPPLGGGGTAQPACFVAAVDGGYFRTEIVQLVEHFAGLSMRECGFRP